MCGIFWAALRGGLAVPVAVAFIFPHALEQVDRMLSMVRSREVWSWLLIGCFCLSISGCGGCRKDKDKEGEDKAEKDPLAEKELPSEPFEFRELVVLPSETGENAPMPAVKPGHWITANKQIIANHYDFSATLDSQCLDVGQQPIETEHTNYRLSTSRPAPLAKGQWRDHELSFYVPRRLDESSPPRSVSLRHRLRARNGGRVIADDIRPVNLMNDYEFLLVVLADNPNDYVFFRSLDAMSTQFDTGDFDIGRINNYRVVLPSITNHVPLPSHSLAWTAIAFILWDNPDYSRFTPDQEQALIDWLHFGGQLIISGPDSLGPLKGSFLEAYLPAEGGDALELDADRLAELDQNWSIPETKNPERLRTMKINDEVPMIGIELLNHPDSDVLPNTGGLVVERRIGRGRIVVTGFSIDHRTMRTWQSFESLVNNCLLRRPSRRYKEQGFGTLTTTFVDFGAMETDPLINSTLRYLSRDLSRTGTPTRISEDRTERPDEADYLGRAERLEMDEDDPAKNERTGIEQDHWHYGGYRNATRSGVAGWNDTSGVSTAARAALKEAAGISPPSAGFVLRTLLVYIAILVPLNWLFFRLIGRVEWAWVAAPLIAIGGAVGVVKMAELDIGFARSRTEISLLELHGGHSRGHLTRYTALYSSLSTPYELGFDEYDSQSQPFAKDPNYVWNSRDPIYDVTLQRDRGVRLTDFQVNSNSTGIVHSEQMLSTGGAIELRTNGSGQRVVENGTNIDIRDAGVVFRDENDRLMGCWLGELGAQSAPQRVNYRSLSGGLARLPEWNESQVLLSHRTEAEALLARFDGNDDKKLAAEEIDAGHFLLEHFAEIDSRGPRASGALSSDDSDNELLNLREVMECCRLNRAGEIGLGEMFDMVTDHLVLRRGETRLIGWTDQELSGLEIRPAGSQSKQRTMIVVHLTPGELPSVKKDLNTRFDFTDPDSRNAWDLPDDDLLDDEDGNNMSDDQQP